MFYKIIYNCFLIFIIPLHVLAESNIESFEVWMQNLKKDALQQNISSETFNEAFVNIINPDEKIIQLYNRQPEKIISFEEYLKRTISNNRIDKGKKQLSKFDNALKEIAEKYGVQSRFIIAIWGLESNFGSFTGKYSVISSLATLAYKSRRKEFFRKQLFYALKIIEQGDIEPEKMKGSWAGAMGQPQFLPSSYINYSTDENSDGKRDIWFNHFDIFGSIANYLKQHGWNDNYTWGREVILSNPIEESYFGINKKSKKSLLEWHNLGVKNINGDDIPTKNKLKANLISANKKGKDRIYLVYDNFLSILAYNNSIFYALSVGILSDKIKN